jgi:hypothetical protein
MLLPCSGVLPGSVSGGLPGSVSGGLPGSVSGDFVSGPGPCDFVSGSGPCDFVSGSGPCDFVSGPGSCYHVSGSGPGYIVSDVSVMRLRQDVGFQNAAGALHQTEAPTLPTSCRVCAVDGSRLASSWRRAC